jgi:hypothetical protein
MERKELEEKKAAALAECARLYQLIQVLAFQGRGYAAEYAQMKAAMSEQVRYAKAMRECK